MIFGNIFLVIYTTEPYIQYVSMQLTISFTLQTYFLDDLDDAEAAELPTKHAKLMPLTCDCF